MSVVPVPQTVQEAVAPLVDVIGMPVDKVMAITCLFATFPLGFVHRFVPTAIGRYLYGLAVGLFYCWACFGPQMIHPFISSLIVYLIMAVFPYNTKKYVAFGESVQGKNEKDEAVDVPAGKELVVVKRDGDMLLLNLGRGVKAWVNKKGSQVSAVGSGSTVGFLFAFAYIMACHVYRHWTDPYGWTLDFTGPQMMITIKLCTFAFNVSDGRRAAAALDKRQSKLAIKSLPNILEYFSFIFFFGGFVSGPAFEFMDYKRFVERTAFSSGRVPWGFKHSLSALVVGLISAGGALASDIYPVSRCAEQDFINANSFVMRYMYMWFSVSLTRFRYYMGWKLAEGGCLMAGFGMEEDKDGKVTAGITKNVDVFGVELAPSLSAAIRNWNMGTQSWLVHYVYKRFPASKMVKLIATNLASAMWHGIYPGYYATFLSAAIWTNVVPVASKIQNMLIPASLHRITSTLGTTLVLNYLTCWFLLLRLETGYEAMKSVYFCCHILSVALMVIGPMLPRSKKKTA